MRGAPGAEVLSCDEGLEDQAGVQHLGGRPSWRFLRQGEAEGVGNHNSGIWSTGGVWCNLFRRLHHSNSSRQDSLEGRTSQILHGLLESVARTRKAGPEPSVTRLLLLLAEMWSASYIIRIQKPGVPESIAWVGTRRCTAPGRTQDTIT